MRFFIFYLSFFVLILTGFSSNAEYKDSARGKLLLSGGIMAGGPLISGHIKGGYGKPGLSIHAGLNYDFKFHERWSIRTGLHFQLKQLEYGQSFKRDTIVEIELQGVKGKVPSYYYADVKGNMRHLSLELPATLQFYLTDRLYFLGGFYGAYHFDIMEEGDVHVQIGEGGLIEDENEKFDNSNYHLPFDFGFKLGAGIEFFRSFKIELYGQRGLISAFKRGFSPDYETGELRGYQTYGAISFIYTPWRFQ